MRSVYEGEKRKPITSTRVIDSGEHTSIRESNSENQPSMDPGKPPLPAGQANAGQWQEVRGSSKAENLRSDRERQGSWERQQYGRGGDEVPARRNSKDNMFG